MLAIIETFKNGQASAADLQLLQRAMASGQIQITGGDKITVGDISSSIGLAIGPGAQSTVNFNISPEKLEQLLKLPRIPLQLPPRPEFLRGRDPELQTLLASLQPGRVHTLLGPGGIGKTALAAEALYRLTQNRTVPPPHFPDGVIYHSFYAQPAPEAALANIALAFGEELKPTPAEAARRALANRCALIYLDGAESCPDLSPILNLAGACGVLVATRDRLQLSPSHQVLRPLSENDSAALLKVLAENQVPMDQEDPSLRRLVVLLGGLPLALRLAGSYLIVHQENLSKYLAWLEESLSVLHKGEHEHESVPLLLKRTCDRLSKPARKVLAMMGLLAFAPFPELLVLLAPSLGASEVHPAFGELARFGLLLRSDGTCQLAHSLIYAYVRKNLKPPKGALSSLAEVLGGLSSLANATGLPQDFMPFKPHVSIVARAVEGVGLQGAAHLWENLGTHLRIIASYSDARSCLERALRLDEAAFGTDHRVVANDLNKLGLVLHELGELVEARLCFERALRIDEVAFGPEDPKIARDANNLGAVLKDLGDLPAARGCFERALLIDEAAFGPEDPEVVRIVNNLGLVLQDLGELDGARDCFERALPIFERVDGPDHPNVATLVNNLGGVLQALGDLSAARDCFERALRIDEAAFGPSHPRVATDVTSLGGVLRDLGDLSAARDCFERALSIFERVLGPDHPNVATLFNNLGLVLRDLGDSPAARDCFERALRIDEAAFGPDHPDVARDVNNLGLVLLALGDLPAARRCFERALFILEKTLPPNHSNTQLARDHLASLSKS